MTLTVTQIQLLQSRSAAIKVQLVRVNALLFQSGTSNCGKKEAHILKNQLMNKQLWRGTLSVKGVSKLPSDEPVPTIFEAREERWTHTMHGSAAIVNDVWRGGMPTLGQVQEVSTQLFSHIGPVSCWHVCVSKAQVHGGTSICKVHFGSLECID